MNRRTALQSLLGAPAILRGARKPGDKPNLLLILTDQQRADTMAVYGNRRYRVPVMNRLASESIVFERCYASQPVCTPSRGSIMTGLWPHSHGCVANGIPLRAETPALPEIVNDPSYRTAYFGKWHLGDECWPQHGFQEWISTENKYDFSPGRDRAKRSDYHYFLLQHGYRPDADGQFSKGNANRPLEHTKAAFLGMKASEFILTNRSQPWILNVSHLEPHRPYEGPLNDLHSEEEAPVPPNYPGIPVEREPACYERFRADNRRKGYNLKERAVVQRLNRNYAGLCSLVDQALGRMLWALQASGQAENTIVVLTADHGEMMGAHSLLAKMVMYEESVRVPLLIHAPFRHTRQIRAGQPVSNVCILPTLLELMGVKAPESLEGESLLPLAQGGQLREDHVFIEWNEPPDGPVARVVVSPQGWKLAQYHKDNCLLFDRGRDPLEMSNLYYRAGSRETVRRLRAKLEAWQGRTRDRVQIHPAG